MEKALPYLMNAANASEYETSDDEISERWSFFANVMEQYANEKVKAFKNDRTKFQAMLEENDDRIKGLEKKLSTLNAMNKLH